MCRMCSQTPWLLLTAVHLMVLVDRPVSAQHRVAWLAPSSGFTPVQAASSMGGLVLGIEHLKGAGGALAGETFVVNWKNSGCSSKASLSSMYEVLVNESFSPDVVIGPVCSAAMEHVADLAGYRDIPIVGWYSESSLLSVKTRYNSLIRTLPPINSIGRALVKTLVSLDWHYVFIITASGEEYAKLGSGVRDAVIDSSVNTSRYVDNVSENPDEAEVDAIYNTLKKEARIVILCVPRADLRIWMLEAEKHGMAGGDYAFIFVNGYLPTDDLYAELTNISIWQRGDGLDSEAKRAYHNLLIFSMKNPDGAVTNQFYQDADLAANDASWQASLGIDPSPSDTYSPYLHDAVKLYGMLVNESREAGLNSTSGSVLLDLARNRVFSEPDLVTGSMIMDENGDRFPVFYLLDMSAEGVFRVVQRTDPEIGDDHLVLVIVELEEILWGDGRVGDEYKPVHTPECGFQAELCPDITLYVALPVAFVVLVIIAFVVFRICRKYQFEKSLKDMVWKIDASEIILITREGPTSMLMRQSRGSNLVHSRSSVARRSSYGGSALIHRSQVSVGKVDAVSLSSRDDGQVFIPTAKYKGVVVAVKEVKKNKVKVDRTLLLEMRTMSNLKHANLATFTGACVDTGHLCEIWEYCSKGSLQDVIYNDNFKLDLMFKFSMAADILKGLKYLHGSSLRVHGRLKSSNIVVDGRCQCKLADYGLHKFRDGQVDAELSEHQQFSSLYWTAPELLAKAMTNRRRCVGTQAADIYAVAVILKEIFAKNGPYTEITDHEDLSPREIIEKVRARGSRHPYRPSLSEVQTEAPVGVVTLIEQGWCQEPTDRPAVHHMLRDLQRHNPAKSTNVMNNMIDMMEKYSNNLEELVGERTKQVEEEKKKSENLLYRMLPMPIAEELKLGMTVKAESFDAVTIYFSDIVKFTNLSAASTPMQVVDLLNSLYTVFDSTIAQHDVYKVETIGDAYMVVSGVPVRNGDNHAVEVANVAMDLLTGILACKVPHMPDYVLRIRIGLHTGPAVAGVVGLTMPRYCLFGNTVNVAAQFESGGAPMRIHLSETTYKILSKFSGYHLADRGSSIDCKKSGKLHSYWLFGRDGRDKPMPDFDELSREDEPPVKKLPVTKGRAFRSSISRPSQESGIFDTDTDEIRVSRRSSASEDSAKLEDIKENSNEDLQSGSVSTIHEPSSAVPVTWPTSDVLCNNHLDTTKFAQPRNRFPPSDAPVGLKRERTLELQDLDEETP